MTEPENAFGPASVFGAEECRVEQREHLGRPARVSVLVRTYDTTVEDLWAAVTTAERLARWFLPVTGDLRPGGRYQLEGNAGGTITRCDPPHTLEVTWEFGGGTSWVHLTLAPFRGRAQLTLEHIAPQDGPDKDHLDRYGPGAVGVGWDLALRGLAWHLAHPHDRIDPARFDAWVKTAEGLAFIRRSGEAWGAADAAAGTDPVDARARADRTIAFYTGA